MTLTELEELAYNNRQMPGGLDVLDQAVYQAYRFLYRHYRSGAISRDDATKEKKAIKLAHEKRLSLDEFGRKCMKHSVDRYKQLEGLAIQYRKNPSLEIADMIVNALDGMTINRPQA